FDVRSLPEELHRELFTGLFDAVPLLNVPEMLRTLRIDEEQLITTTLLGEPVFRVPYRFREVEPAYVILVHQTSDADHFAAAATEISLHLRRSGVRIEIYSFRSEPSVFVGEAGESAVTLEDIGRRHANDRLILFGDAATLFHPLSGLPQSWAAAFASWRKRALLAPVPPSRWGYGEGRVASEGFLMLPASTLGLTAFATQCVNSADSSSSRSLGGGIAYAERFFPPLLSVDSIHKVSGDRPRAIDLES